MDGAAAAHAARALQDGETAKVVEPARRSCRIVRSRCGTEQVDTATSDFDAWLDNARRSGGRVVENFVASLAADGARGARGPSPSMEQRPSGGQVNCLKLLKRSIYGRAKLDLLRRRFLLAS